MPAPRLPEHPRVAAAALARRGADPARDRGRRHRDRHHHHADGRRPGHRRRCCWPSASRSAPTTPPPACTTAWRRSARELIVAALEGLRAGALPAQPQPAEGVTYAHKIDKRRGVDRLERCRRGASSIAVRAFDPLPGRQHRARTPARRRSSCGGQRRRCGRRAGCDRAAGTGRRRAARRHRAAGVAAAAGGGLRRRRGRTARIAAPRRQAPAGGAVPARLPDRGRRKVRRAAGD